MRDLAAVSATAPAALESKFMIALLPSQTPKIYKPNMQNPNIVITWNQFKSYQLNFSQHIPQQNPPRKIHPPMGRSPQPPRWVSVASSWRAATWRAASPWWISRARSIASCPGDDDEVDIGLWVVGWDDGMMEIKYVVNIYIYIYIYIYVYIIYIYNYIFIYLLMINVIVSYCLSIVYHCLV